MSESRSTSSRVLDQVFGRWVADNFGDASAKLRALAEAVSYANYLKHSCLDLRTYRDLGDEVLEELLKGITAKQVQQLFKPVKENLAPHPLVVSEDGHTLWLQKYYRFESEVAQSLKARSVESAKLSPAQIKLLDALFDENSREQRRAAEKALTHPLAVITGGPGTGKTWTVARLLILLLQENPQQVIRLAAPTGKAGARMEESLRQALLSVGDGLPSSARTLQQLKASTLDSLLKITPQSPHARKNARDPLDCDVLIVDEASMIALPMMYRLLQALPARTRLVLLGDKDQLASVEAGAVLGDICSSSHPGLKSAIAEITRSRRFAAGSGIGTLANSLNRGEVVLPEQADKVCLQVVSKAEDPRQPAWLPTALAAQQQLLQELARAHSDEQVKALLKAQTRFQILCALREGPYGVRGINDTMARALGHSPESWYAGRPVMITRNDRARHLNNGDVGLVLPRPAADGGEPVLKACFLVGDTLREISRAQMPPHETCYAMTVHKSQGSEYDQVAIVLPQDADTLSPVITRELVYTAVTRAKECVDIWCGERVLETAAKRTLQRMSGLQDLLAS